jgi:predicted adenylyl cyclase CyaB
MVDEIELKFLEINKDLMITKLKKIGAKLKYNTVLEGVTFQAKGFSRKNSSMKYLRLRKNQNTVFLTYKGPAKDKHFHIRDEIEIQVNDFNNAIELISKLGFNPGKIFSKNRIHYEISNFKNLGKVSFEIDEYPHVHVFLEIEVSSIKQMPILCKQLGLRMESGKKEMITEIYPELFIDKN